MVTRTGAAAATHPDAERLARSALPWAAGRVAVTPAARAPAGVAPNANGAGDACCAGFLGALVVDGEASLGEALGVAGAVAAARVFDLPRRPLAELLADARRRSGG